jgi:RNA polymerase sigma-70 factor (family 1)
LLANKTHSVNDTSFLSQMREGVRPAFDSLYEKYKKDVFNEAYKRLSDPDLAKDITQDVFTALWVRGSQTIIDNLPGYLYSSIKNNVYRLMQREKKFVPIADLLIELDNNNNRADADLLYAELVKAYEGLIANLPEQQRIIYKMRYNENLSPDEIAEKLNLSPKTVRNHLGRALAHLKDAFLLVQLMIWLSDKN